MPDVREYLRTTYLERLEQRQAREEGRCELCGGWERLADHPCPRCASPKESRRHE